MVCHCGNQMHRVYHSYYGCWMWKCTLHGIQAPAQMSDTQLTLEQESGWR